MKKILLGIGILTAALAANVQPSDAAQRAFCLSGNRANGGMPDCSYSTWEQCRASVSGSDSCYANPALQWGTNRDPYRSQWNTPRRQQQGY